MDLIDPNQQMAAALNYDPATGVPYPNQPVDPAINAAAANYFQRAGHAFLGRFGPGWPTPTHQTANAADTPQDTSAVVGASKPVGDYSDPNSPFNQATDAQMEWAMALAGGPRKLGLQPVSRWGYAHDYNITDPATGEALTHLKLQAGDKKNLKVDMIGEFGSDFGPDKNANSIGPGSLRTLIPQLKELYPDAETITGHRVTGAREQAGSIGRATLQLRPPTVSEPLPPEAQQMANQLSRRYLQSLQYNTENKLMDFQNKGAKVVAPLKKFVTGEEQFAPVPYGWQSVPTR